MAKQVFINLPVSDLEVSTAFYQSLGFIKNEMFSDETASAMQWSDDITVMLLGRDFYKTFIGDKEVADTTKTSAALLALTFDTREEVDAFADAAVQNGGSSFKVPTDIPEDQMYGHEVLDPDGHQWEAMWMTDEEPES